ncbi:YkuS family protein [Radiobacillus kanasensis]|uniref:YkuS family protein n=1 Tax=Radiobacillus kanasensis TaxID=2844358 RepID=UPI001E3E5151|nr:YkuS family protein [Radiobacillus kanasensis]UFU00874.1 YkuS family protein [Radiobacillus kanasensis]
MAKIGIEQSLSNVKSALEERGHQVMEIKQAEDAKQCDCCCVTGQDKNVMGMAATDIAAPVINCDGMSADEVCQHVEQNLR